MNKTYNPLRKIWRSRNPRNGGDGFDLGDGTWRDRRWAP